MILNVIVKEDDFLSHSLDTRVKNKLRCSVGAGKACNIVKDGEKEESIWTTAKTVQEFFKDQEIR